MIVLMLFVMVFVAVCGVVFGVVFCGHPRANRRLSSGRRDAVRVQLWPHRKLSAIMT